jgi:hypothetical protein
MDGKPSVKKKTLQLAQLVSASMQTSSSSDSNDHHALSTYQTVMEPGDFWKHCHDWNILQHFVESNTTATSTSSNKPLPNTFVSHGHYISAWASPRMDQQCWIVFNCKCIVNVNPNNNNNNKQQQQRREEQAPDLSFMPTERSSGTCSK